MGAAIFHTTSTGNSAQDAFDIAVRDACIEHGMSGYTGTIAEKTEFILIDLPTNTRPQDWATHLIDQEDERIDDKWGPAGCFNIGNNCFYFFGWASS